MIKKLLSSVNLTVYGVVFFLLGFLLMFLRWHHSKLGPHSEQFEIFLGILDVIVGLIFIIRILGYTLQIIHKS